MDIEFPPLPRTIAEVSELLGEHLDAPDTPRLVQAVHNDPVIATAVLRRINSAYYGTRRQIYDIRRAVFLLGFEEVCDIVVASAMVKLRDVLAAGEQENMYDQILRLSLGTALFSKCIAHHLHIVERERTFTAGLMHSIGRLILLYNRPDDYEALWFTNDQGVIPSTTSEQIIFGIDHTELGARAAQTWGLPPFIGESIRYYLVPGRLKEPDLRIMAMTISAASSAAEQFCVHASSVRTVFRPNAAFFALAKMTGTSSADLIEFIEATASEATAYVTSMVDEFRTAA
ncbi:MAG: HDOD domain-containing protein [Rhodothermales bacterium]